MHLVAKDCKNRQLQLTVPAALDIATASADSESISAVASLVRLFLELAVSAASSHVYVIWGLGYGPTSVGNAGPRMEPWTMDMGTRTSENANSHVRFRSLCKRTLVLVAGGSFDAAVRYLYSPELGGFLLGILVGTAPSGLPGPLVSPGS